MQITDTKMETYTLTFSEAVENHAKMQIIGEKANCGFSNEYCIELANKFGGEIINLKQNEEQPDSIVVIFRNGLQNVFGLNSQMVFDEQYHLNKDKKAFMYGKVVNKKARHNLCFADMNQEPDYENRKGTIISFNNLPLLSDIREKIGNMFGDECKNLFAEGNYYYDIKKCYIGFHGDSERKKVIGVRLGQAFPLHFRWFQKGKAEKSIQTIQLNEGDVYIMSEKATGNDWKHRSLKWTLRHSAGNLSLYTKDEYEQTVL